MKERVFPVIEEKLVSSEVVFFDEKLRQDAERAVRRAEALYRIANPKIGAMLVEANIVLTLADVRGQTEFFIDNPEEDDQENIKKLDTILKPWGLSIRVIGEIRKDSELMVNIGSIQGYARMSRSSKLSGVVPFEASSGWDGLRRWNDSLWRNLKQAQNEGRYPHHFDMGSVLSGIHKGYPDVAILDAADAFGKKSKSELENSNLAFVELYKGAEPNYVYHKDHASNPEIIAHKKKWEKILEYFYNSSWHMEIKNNAAFIEARSRNDMVHEILMHRRANASHENQTS